MIGPRIGQQCRDMSSLGSNQKKKSQSTRKTEKVANEMFLIS